MKMQNEIRSPERGRVLRVFAQAGAVVNAGQPLPLLEYSLVIAHFTALLGTTPHGLPSPQRGQRHLAPVGRLSSHPLHK
jgi:hypothetical protein